MIVVQKRGPVSAYNVLKEWKVDKLSKFPNIDTSMFPAAGVWSVYANGLELDQLRDDFKNIPHTLASACSWSGDVAEFIINNMKHIYDLNR